jgi:subtilisin family serine protease
MPSEPTPVLVKLRPSTSLQAAEARADLRPLYDPSPEGAFGAAGGPAWFIADLPEGADTPWDLAHARVADQLGVKEGDVLFAEPDLVHRDVYPDTNEADLAEGFAAGTDCAANPQDARGGKAVGPADVFAWHLGDGFSQLGAAREAVAFSAPRTRIAHLDTGYYRAHETTPAHLLHDLEKSFVPRDRGRNSAEDPDHNLLLFDNSGHGTGTIGILAGGPVSTQGGARLGGAPEAEVLPLRVADSVILLRTSAFAQALKYAREHRCDVVTMSMGGLPSKAWAEAVDAAYESGVCICAAAGNHVGPSPPRVLVYPARYDRVLAVCGVMANGKPYDGLKGNTMEGCFGPASAMRSALCAYTPNIPWPRFLCPDSIRLNGEGTSSATPQVAAAAALWFERYKAELPRDWRRVEAVRHALFSTAKQKDLERLGNGVLQARAALDVRPHLGRPKSAPADSSWAFLRVLTGLGVAGASAREEMFNLELAQRWLVNESLQEAVPDPDAAEALGARDLRKLMEAVIEDEGASLTLRKHAATRYPIVAGRPAPVVPRVVPPVLPPCDAQPTLGDPPFRRIRVYAVDPSLSARLDTASTNEVTLRVRWEPLRPGPIGEYLAVKDLDASGKWHQDATGKKFDPVDLNDPRLLAQDGWSPSEGNPQFHQQMVYAVASKTIEHFERALGRPVLWRPKGDEFVPQLAVRPHALRQANAFYSPEEVALKFGYFDAGADRPGDHVPGSRVYSCLSHDIIAHETAHAILDGIHQRFSEPTNPDVLALHEGFSDLVALLQHFTIPEVLEREIAQTRGDLRSESMLGSLAVQFGQASGGHSALREAIGRVEEGKWKPFVPDPSDLQKRVTPHARGAVLVAAVFDAFIAIYETRIADLLRLYTGGTGVLSGGAIHPDLVHRLADEASKSATHVLGMCIRALDYVPPVDVTFFEYLRALITADFDLVRDDRHNYRVAFVEAFRRRGIYPATLGDPADNVPRTLSVETLRWRGLDPGSLPKGAWEKVERQYKAVVKELQQFADTCIYLSDRKQLFDAVRAQRKLLQGLFEEGFKAAPEFAREVGLDPDLPFQVHDLRRAVRVGPTGQYIPQVILALTQEKEVPADRATGTPRHTFSAGSTLVVDLAASRVKYRIVKNMSSSSRPGRTATFVRESASDPLRALFLSPDRREPFAALHALADEAGLGPG